MLITFLSPPNNIYLLYLYLVLGMKCILCSLTSILHIVIFVPVIDIL
uniref:Uncharacterized protein n=1 Tax=Anguilla anguilla TaxID=7936 RepID=A0A0E9UKX4_ANGAN